MLLNLLAERPTLKTVAGRWSATDPGGFCLCRVLNLLEQHASLSHYEIVAVDAVVVVVVVAGGAGRNDGVIHDGGDGEHLLDHPHSHLHSLHRDFRNFLGTHFRTTSRILEHYLGSKIVEGVAYDVVASGEGDHLVFVAVVVAANGDELQQSHYCHYNVVVVEYFAESVSAVAAVVEVVDHDL